MSESRFDGWGPELAVLNAILEQGDRAGAVVIGAPGAGKTSLVRAVLADGRFATSLNLQCSAALGDVPYGALSPFLTELDDVHGPVDVLRAMQRQLDSLLDAASAQASACRMQPRPVIVVEDCQFLDAASAFVLAQLGQNREAVLLATSVGALGGESGLDALVDTGLLATVTVQPFAVSQARMMCASLLGGTPTEGALGTIVGMTGGNPRLIAAFVTSAVGQDILVPDQEAPFGPGASARWTLLRPAPSVDERLVDTVESMQAELTDEQQLVVTMLALAGRLPRSLLRALAGDQVRDLADVRVTRETPDGMVELSSPLYAEVLHSTIPPGRSSDLLGQWRSAGGAALQPPPGRSVLWTIENGQPVSESDLVAAGYEFLAADDQPAAWSLATQHGPAPSARTALFEAEVMLAGGRTWSGRDELVKLADRVTDDSLLAEILCVVAMNLLRYGERESAGEALAQVWSEYLERASTQQRDARLTAGPLADMLRQLGRGSIDSERPRLKALTGALLADGEAHPAVRIVAHWLLAQVLTGEGRLLEAVRESQSAYVEASATARLTALMGVQARAQLVLAHVRAGELDAAAGLLDEEHAGARRWHARSGTVLALHGVVELCRGRLKEGISALRDATVDLAQADPAQLGPLVGALHSLATSVFVASSGASAVDRIWAGGQRGPTNRWLLALAVASLSDERSRRGASEQSPLWRLLLDDPVLARHPVIRREILYLATVSQDADDEADELRVGLYRACAALDGQRSSLIRMVCDPAVASDPVRLAEAADQVRAAGDLMLSADAWARVVMLHDHAGDLRRRGEALRHLQDHVHELGGIPSRHVGEALRLGALTDREREIVQLALQGRTNADIADVLVVSPRTIEGHLYRAFTKLGISDRAGLRGLTL